MTKIFVRISVLFLLVVSYVGCATEYPTLSEINQSLQSDGDNAKPPQENQTADEGIGQPAVGKIPTRFVHLGPNEDIMSYIEDASGPVLIDFYADWCGPCKMQGRELNEMKTWLAENDVTVIKINVDEHDQLSSLFRVQALPTLIAVNNSKITDRQVGFADMKQVVALLATNRR